MADLTPSRPAGCPNATQPEPCTVSILFLKPPAVNWQVFCESWREGSDLAMSQSDFGQALSLG